MIKINFEVQQNPILKKIKKGLLNHFEFEINSKKPIDISRMNLFLGRQFSLNKTEIKEFISYLPYWKECDFKIKRIHRGYIVTFLGIVL